MRELEQLACSALILTSVVGHKILVYVLRNYNTIQNTSATGEAGHKLHDHKSQYQIVKNN